MFEFFCTYRHGLSRNGWHSLFCIANNRHGVTITTHAFKRHFLMWMTTVRQPTKRWCSCFLALKYTSFVLSGKRDKESTTPYPEPVYTGWSSVHWNATGMPLVDPVYTGIPLEKLSWNSPTLECHWRNLVESAPHWDATGETLTFAAYTGTPLEGLWQPTHAPTHIVEHAE